ncbi:S1C family serine protease [Paenibacillus tarimensis]
MKKQVYRIACGLAAGILFFTSLSVQATTAASPGLEMEAQLIQGEVYVKASSLTALLGGSGTFNTKTSNYTYNPPDDIPQVIEKVSPSVVAIIGKPAAAGNDDRYLLSHGTGVVLKSNGLIVTNAHVVKGMSSIVVVTANGEQYNGKRLNIDETSDLALIKINASGLKPAEFAESLSELRAGETVIAIGTPVSFSLRNTATVGVLSGMNRSVSSAYKLLQTDAAINPGNSGGPLVNLKGEVIGINTLKFVQVGVDSLGFSIPADTVQYVIRHFEKYGKVKRASLGLELEESWAAIVGLPTEEPLTITSVNSEEARKAKIKAGDVLYSAAGTQISSIVELNELLKQYLPGQHIELMLSSDGDLVTRKLTLVEQ